RGGSWAGGPGRGARGGASTGFHRRLSGLRVAARLRGGQRQVSRVRVLGVRVSRAHFSNISSLATSSQVFLEQRRRVGFLVAVLDDHGSVEREPPAGGRRAGYGPRAGHDDRPGGNLERSLTGPSV